MPTKDEIQERMFLEISNDYDKSEGSFIYDATVGVAIALEDGYIEMDLTKEKIFVKNLFGDELKIKCAEYGVYKKDATFATTNLTVTGTNGTTIPAGSRFFVDSIYFSSTVDATITNGTVLVNVTCEQSGSIGNVPANTIVNMDVPIQSVSSVTNLIAVTNGTDEESDDDLKERYYEKLRTPSTSGNAQHYINWCKDVAGVGDAKVFPLWNGNGTVKCVIINANKRAADQTLIDAVVANVEANRPIGATVTVESSIEKTIDVTVDITLSPGYDLATIQTAITDKLTEYFKDIAFNSNYVSVALIGSKILEVEGVTDYTNLTLNGAAANVNLADNEIPVEGVVNAS